MDHEQAGVKFQKLLSPKVLFMEMYNYFLAAKYSLTLEQFVRKHENNHLHSNTFPIIFETSTLVFKLLYQLSQFISPYHIQK